MISNFKMNIKLHIISGYKFYVSLIPLTFILSLLFNCPAQSQADFFKGADLSYVNEMEDCGATYYVNGSEADPYQLMADFGCNLARIRLWHTPSWYDNLNSGKRYSDLQDVMKSLSRAKQAGMKSLLDFHLSDTWADPSRQLAPKAWENVLDNLDLLSDSLYNYIFNTLKTLDEQSLLPDMVQIVNETNKGILLSGEDNQGWVLDWSRNKQLFNRAIRAVRDFEEISDKAIEIVLHFAGPDESEWLAEAFRENDVRDYDIIAISYYWAWHQPTGIKELGELIRRLKSDYPDKQVLIVETAYIWTMDSWDNANNIIDVLHPDYSPASPAAQKKWMVDLATEISHSGGCGLVYWEPCWVSTDCHTQWGQGSHQENACFFDRNNNLIIPGGAVEWMLGNYGTNALRSDADADAAIQLFYRNGILRIRSNLITHDMQLTIVDTSGRKIAEKNVLAEPEFEWLLPDLQDGLYYIIISDRHSLVQSRPVFIY